MNDIILSTQNGEPVASSRDVAKRFGKEHKHVLAAIRQLLVAENSATKFFHETAFEYRGQKFPEYLSHGRESVRAGQEDDRDRPALDGQCRFDGP